MAATLGADTKQQILEGTFAYLVECGLESFRIKDLVNRIQITEGTIYYWYKNRDELVCDAAEYGLKKMSDDIFSYFFKNITRMDDFFDDCLKSIDYAKKELRFIYQMAASPIYGDSLRNSTNHFVRAYDEYAGKLAELSGGDIEEIQPIVYLFAACVVDYAVWQNSTETQIQLNYIRKLLKRALSAKEEIAS